MKKQFFILFALIISTFSACDLKEKVTSATDAVSDGGIVEDTEMDLYLNDAVAVSEIELAKQADPTRQAQASSTEPCYVATYNLAEKKLTIDFGEGCTYNGFERTGKIILTLKSVSYPILFPVTKGAIWEMTFEDYTVAGYALEGSRSIKNITEDPLNEEKTYEITLNNLKITKNGKSTQRNGVIYERTTISASEFTGSEKAYWGTINGITSDDTSYTHTTEEQNAIIYKVDCISQGFVFPSSGIKKMEWNGNARTIDFGSGDCDNTFTVSQGFVSFTVTFENGEVKISK
ncbi:hypothetical protein [Persicobacter sp. CCB-QB2]|uniref:hypothetical protein n=1 Tax=Persicobacter sp. CCB-QB2 TaxID=1561025 RepID=UPI0006A9EFAF|nr:hypothetical protein [Persicobacter sp. CCB-QB2]